MFAGDSGGFMQDGDSQQMQAQGERSLRPVTIKQIENAEGQEDQLRLTGRPLDLVKVIGIVSSEETHGTRSNYTITDNTGELRVTRFWTDNRDGEGEQELDQETLALQNQCKEGSMVVAIGALREFNGTRSLTAQMMRPIKPNEYPFHLIDVMSVTQHLSQLAASGGAGMSMGGGAVPAFSGADPFAQSASLGAAGGAAAAAPATDQGAGSSSQAIIELLRERDDEEMGVERTSLHAALQGRFSVATIDNDIAVLMDEGHIFNVFDNDHFKVTS